MRSLAGWRATSPSGQGRRDRACHRLRGPRGVQVLVRHGAPDPSLLAALDMIRDELKAGEVEAEAEVDATSVWEGTRTLASGNARHAWTRVGGYRTRGVLRDECQV